MELTAGELRERISGVPDDYELLVTADGEVFEPEYVHVSTKYKELIVQLNDSDCIVYHMA